MSKILTNIKQGKNRIIIDVLGVVILSTFIVSLILGQKNVKRGFIGNNIGNHMEAKFNYFDGKEINIEKFKEGSNVSIDYKINIVEGNLKVEVTDESGNLIAESKDKTGKVEFKVDKTQNYKINLVADKSKGNYSITWDEKK